MSELLLQHKDGCIAMPGWVHRVPIDCTTLPQLWTQLSSQEEEIKDLKAKIVSLKAKLWDYEHEEE